MTVLEANNPLPFQQPFLQLMIKGDVAKTLTPECPFWLIDVGGHIDTYISKKNTPKKPLIALCRRLAKAGIAVTGFYRYNGSAGPHIVMRNGVLFYRMGMIDRIPTQVLAFAYKAPVYGVN